MSSPSFVSASLFLLLLPATHKALLGSLARFLLRYIGNKVCEPVVSTFASVQATLREEKPPAFDGKQRKWPLSD